MTRITIRGRAVMYRYHCMYIDDDESDIAVL